MTEILFLSHLISGQLYFFRVDYHHIVSNIHMGSVLRFVFSSEDKPLGRLSSEIATILRGKNKPQYTPHMDIGDNVVVINSEKVKLTGNKMAQKEYFRHSGYPGSEKFTTAEELLAKDPTALVTRAVKGMLPKNRLGRKLLTNLRVYAGPVHPHTAQQPEIKEI